ncbi:unnamed protein product [marine sediment metagenome]|uniref:Uncharacterized protein n=1 Tax=marine sediment metagenome TaxID=412755 RepID=X1E4U0_9ZZZZ
MKAEEAMHLTTKRFEKFLKLASRAQLERMLLEIYELSRRE